MFRKFTTVLLAGILAFAPLAQAAETATPPVTILLDGYPLPFSVEPAIVNGRTMVPFRTISEALGVTVQWDGNTRTITAVDPDAKEIRLTIDASTAWVDGVPFVLDAAPMIVNGATLIPLSFFSQQFGAQVGWEASTRTVSIQSPLRDTYTLAFYALSSFSEVDYVPSFDSVAFGWSRIDAEGNFTLSGKDFYWPKPAGEITPESIVQTAAERGTSPYLMVFASDGQLELTGILENKARRSELAAEIAGLAVKRGFQGVMLDFEGLGLSGDALLAQKQFNAFVRTLSEQLEPHGLQLGLALHPLNSSFKGYDYATLGKLADEIVIMAYAYEGEKAPEPLGKVDEAIRLALEKVDKNKLVLGISMGSENASSVNGKIGLAKRYGLKGIALWRLGIVGDSAFEQIRRSIELK